MNHAFEKQFSDLPAKVRREFRKHGVVIIDYHTDPYYGSLDNADTVTIAKKRSTTRAYSYLTAELWSPRGNFTIALLHRPPGESTSNLFWDLWARIEMIVTPKLLLFDGEFATVNILEGLGKRRVPFIGRKSITRRMKKVEEDGPAIPEPKAKKTSKKDKKSKKTSKPKAHPEYGKDVTKDFEDAGTLGLKVYEKNKWFNIFDPETEEVLNGKNLRKKFVASFLAEYSIEEDEVEDDDEDEDEDEDEVEDDEVEDDDDDEEDDE